MSVYRKINLTFAISTILLISMLLVFGTSVVDGNVLLSTISVILFGFNAWLLAIIIEFTNKLRPQSVQSRYSLPFNTICNHEITLKTAGISFDSTLILRIDGSLSYEVIMTTDIGKFTTSVPIRFNIQSFYWILSLDREYLYKIYFEPLALYLISNPDGASEHFKDRFVKLKEQMGIEIDKLKEDSDERI